MADLVLWARLVLAAVFAFAAVAKLRSPAETARTAVELGVPARLGPAAARLVPGVELLAAAALAVDALAVVGAALAMVLLGVFSAAMVISLRRGQHPDCHCFGRLQSAPVGKATLARNACLAAAAGVVVVWGPGASLSSLGSAASAAAPVMGVGALCLAVVEGWYILQLTRQQGRLLLRIDTLAGSVADERRPPAGLPVGATAPTFALPALTGEEIRFERLLAHGGSLMLVFLSPGCGPCRVLAPELARWQHQWGESTTLVAVFDRPPEPDLVDAAAMVVVVDEGDAVSDAYRVAATPSAVVVAPDGTVVHTLAEGADEIRELLATLPAPNAAVPGTNGRHPGETDSTDLARVP